MLHFATLSDNIAIGGDKMETNKIGKLLKNIRESKGLTQEEVGKTLKLGRDAMIKIEKGVRKISAEELKSLEEYYNVSIEDLLEPKVDQHHVKGIILAGGTGTRLYPITEATSKQLVPVYDKPMIFYPLSVLMQAGIKDILVITTPEDQENFKRLLGDGNQFGIQISYIVQPSPDGLAQAFILGEEFIGDNPCAMVLGDNIYYGNGLEKELQKAVNNAEKGYATIFGYQVKDPERFGIMEIDKYNNVLSVEEKPTEPKSDYAITGLYFYPKGVAKKAKEVTPSSRGELEITSLNDKYLQEKKLKASILGEGYTWFDTGTFESLLEASNMIRAIEKNKDIVICCPEIIGYSNGWLSLDKFSKRAILLNKNSYGNYLMKIAEREIKNEKNKN